MYQTDDNLHHQGIGMTTVKQTTKQQDHNNAIQKSVFFFFLEYGRCRTVARSLHEYKQ